jgi:uncharacterized damage-inducible protein DinB
MSLSLQLFVAAATQKAAADLITAVERIPADKRDWSPGGSARTTLDQAAECAVLNGYTADMVQTRQWPIGDFEEFVTAKAAALSGGWESLRALLEQSTERLVTVIQTVPEEDLENELQLPWSKQTVAQISAYAYWNMSYHEGQINYIASILGCLG